EAQCTVTEPDGTRVRGLTRDDFRLWEDGTEQKVSAFDAATTPASIALMLDASPSIYRELRDMRGVARSLAQSLQPEDEVAVVAFADETQVLLPFSRDRKLLQAALTSPQLAQPLMTPAARRSGIPLYTLYLAELTRQVGGELYFLREVGSLAEIYHSIALKLEAEYTLGYYPAAGVAKPGWRKLKVELRPD